jgi:Fe-S cluster assembly ATP-binding protein
VPDQVHVLSEGRIIRTGDHTLAAELEANGYGPSFAEPVPTP